MIAISKAKMASELLGLGTGGGELQKLKIEYETGKKAPEQYETIEAMFNPNQIGLSKSVQWRSRRVAALGPWSAVAYQEFRSSDPPTLAIELFFDTYESKSGRLSLGHVAAFIAPTNPLTSSPEATPVTGVTDRVAALAQVNQDLHRPPHCKLSWGKFHIFSGVLTDVNTTFTMFMPDGMPVRARMSCTFIEHISIAYAVKGRELFSADVAKTRTVRRNDTLHSLAAEEYNDPSLWRHIARANGIVNPRDLKPGTVLTIPKLRP